MLCCGVFNNRFRHGRCRSGRSIPPARASVVQQQASHRQFGASSSLSVSSESSDSLPPTPRVLPSRDGNRAIHGVDWSSSVSESPSAHSRLLSHDDGSVVGNASFRPPVSFIGNSPSASSLSLLANASCERRKRQRSSRWGPSPSEVSNAPSDSVHPEVHITEADRPRSRWGPRISSSPSSFNAAVESTALMDNTSPIHPGDDDGTLSDASDDGFNPLSMEHLSSDESEEDEPLAFDENRLRGCRRVVASNSGSFLSGTSIDCSHLGMQKSLCEDTNIACTTVDAAHFRDAHFVVEIRNSPCPLDRDEDEDQGDCPLRHPGVVESIAFPRARWGMFVKDHLHQCPHGELIGDDLDSCKEKANSFGVPVRHLHELGKLHVESFGHHHFLLSLEEDRLKDRTASLRLRDVWHDQTLKRDQTRPGKHTIVVQSSRGNRGLHLGWTGTHSTRDGPDGVRVPNDIAGTPRCAPLFSKFTKLCKEEWESAFPDTPLVDESLHPNRLSDFAEQTHKENMFELMSVLFLVHRCDGSVLGPDKVKFHCDRHDCPDWPLLFDAWDTFFCSEIDMHVTAVVTACWKDSGSQHYKRLDTIGAAADWCIEQHHKTPQRFCEVALETHCPVGVGLLVDETHCDPLVNMGPLTHAVLRLRHCLRTEHHTSMSEHLLVEMVVAATSKCNNSSRFSDFARCHFDLWKRSGCDLSRNGFHNHYRHWLGEHFKSFDGVEDLCGKKRGGVRFQTNNVHPQLDSSCTRSVSRFCATMKKSRGKTMTSVLCRETVRLMSRDVSGMDQLLSQKAIIALVALCLHWDLSALNHTLPGSKESMDALRVEGCDLEDKESMCQVVMATSKKLEVPAAVAEEIVCKTTKEINKRQSGKRSHKGHDNCTEGEVLPHCSLDSSGLPEVHLLFPDGNTSHLDRGGYNNDLDRNHCVPDWAIGDEQPSFSVILSTRANMKHNMSKKTSEKEMDKVESTPVLSDSEIVDPVSTVSLLLNKNQCLVIDDMVLFVAQCFRLRPTELIRGVVTVKVGDGGHRCDLKPDAVSNSTCVPDIQRINKDHLPPNGLVCREPVYHSSRSCASNAFLLHCLFNTDFGHGQSWMWDFLKPGQTRETIVLVPNSRENKSSCKAVAIVSREQAKERSPLVCVRCLCENSGTCKPKLHMTRDTHHRLVGMGRFVR